MFKLLLLLLLFNCVFSKEAEITSEKCKEMFEPHSANIVDCCDAPQLETGIECIIECTIPNDDNCSCPNCLKENNYVPEKKDPFLKLYDYELNKKFTTDEKENWLPVIRKSYEHCKPLLEILNGTDECQFPKNYQPIVTCMRQENFLNCPRSSFAPSEECEATRKFIKEQDTCGTKYEDIFVIDDSIFDQYTDQRIKCKETFRKANLNSKKIVALPDISPPENVYEGCAQKCSSNDCCFILCILNITSTEDFGKEVVKDKIIEFIKSDTEISGTDYDIWKPVIESSFKICYPLASKVIGTKKCNFPMKFAALALCMHQEMFLNAPSSLIEDPDQFEKIKAHIANETKCGQKLGEKFIVDGVFWLY